MSKIETNTIDTVSGTTNLTIGSSNASTVTFESGATTGHMNPAFLAYLSSTTEVSNNVVTKVQIDTEVFDTDNCYDNSTNYRFTPNKAGKYFVYLNITGKTSNYKLYFMNAKLYKNGSEEVSMNNTIATDAIQRTNSQINFIVDMNGSSDYLEMYGHIDIHTNGTEEFVGGSKKSTYFGAYRIGA